MAYSDIANMARNGDLRERIAACAAKEGVHDPHPTAWADAHQWRLAASPGWEEAWAYARGTGVENIGRNEGVINDQMILAAVQGLRADLEATP